MKWCIFVICILLASCSTLPSNAPAPEASATPSPSPTLTPTLPPAASFSTDECIPAQLVIPTLPAEIPGYTELDPSTGLHVTGEYVPIDIETYRLEVTGKVDNPLSLSYDELRCLPYREITATIICRGYFEDRATWGGVPLSFILEMAGIQDDAERLTFKSADGFMSSAPMRYVENPDNLIAYTWEGEPLPLLHGFPVRAAFPGQAGSHWAKYVVEIIVE